jgi:exo-beta-1,3-glucanase (GH17 family)
MNSISNRSANSIYPSLCGTGNHESECHDPACVVNPRQLGIPLSNFTAYNARWKMPSAESGGVESMWYRCVLSTHF